MIAEQDRFLQEQAEKVLEDAQRNAHLNHIACNFKKIPGKTYYVYKKPDLNAKEYMSMISPEVRALFQFLFRFWHTYATFPTQRIIVWQYGCQQVCP